MTTRYCALPDSVCIEVRGTDATAFLHGQLAVSLTSSGPSDAPLAGWHDARGRVRALVRVHHFPDHWLLVAPSDGAGAFVNKLKLFVLRSAVTIDTVAEPRVAAIVDASTEWLERHGAAATAPNRSIAAGELRLTRIGGDLWQLLGHSTALAAVASSLPVATPLDVAAAEIALGLPSITAALAERFVAQMLNLDVLGAVAFDKGCYPGQEIIARVHNLGGVKRRSRRYFAATAALPVGAPVTADGANVGEVVRSAATPTGCELLAVVDNAAAGNALSSGGVALAARPLPFEVPRD